MAPRDRLHQLDVPLYAITGSVGTGKSTVADYLRKLGHPCLDADVLIKQIYQQKDTQTFVASLDPLFLTSEGQINFQKLRHAFYEGQDIKQKIQEHLYRKLPRQFLQERAKRGKIHYLFYDVPLLFENGLETKVDGTIVVYCSKEEQLKRILARDGISPELAAKIMASQMDIEEKKQRGDWVLLNNTDEQALFAQLDKLLEKLL